MPHPFDKYREYINEPIGEIEALIAKIEAWPAALGSATVSRGALGALNQAKDELSDFVADIDNYEEEPASADDEDDLPMLDTDDDEDEEDDDDEE